MNRSLAIVSLVLLPLLWLWPHVFGDRLFVPFDVDAYPPASITIDQQELDAARTDANRDVTEVPIWFLPELELASREIAAGRFPSWNPNARHGAPLHAHGLIGLLYPPNWFAWFSAEPAARLGLVAWCNLVIAGLLAFGLFRSLGHGLLAAWFGAALFELSLPVAANAFFWMRLAAFIWLPGILWAMHAIARNDAARLRGMLATAWCYAMVWLAGFPPFAATATVFAGLWFVWLVGTRMRERGGPAAFRLAITLGIALALGAAWALPQVLPSLAFFPESARPVTPDWNDIRDQAFAPYGLWGYLMPDAFGDPTIANRLPYNRSLMQLLWTTHIGRDGRLGLPNYNYTEYSVYVSQFAIVMALLGACFGRARHAWFARVAIALGIGLGMFWPGIQLLFHLPVVQNAWPMRWLAATTPFVIWAAVLGVERLQALPTDRRALPLIGAGICATFAIALWFASGSAQTAADAPDLAVATLAERYECSTEDVLNHVCGPEPNRDRKLLTNGPEHFAARSQFAMLWMLAIGALLGVTGFVRSAAVRRLTIAGAMLTALAQLTIAGHTITRGTDDIVHDDTPVHRFLREQAAASQSGGFTIVRTAAGEALPSQLGPGQVMAPGVRDLNFYSHADKRSLQPLKRLLDRYQPALGLAENAGERVAGKGYLTTTIPAALLRHPWFDLMNVRYALATEPLDNAGIGQRVGPELQGRGAFFIYERPGAKPRAYTVPRVVALETDDAVLDAITAKTLVPREQAFVAAKDFGYLSTPPTTLEARELRFVRDDPTTIEIEVAAGEAPFLVLADTYLPGWTATVDGEPTDLVRCNHSQRLVRVPLTDCTVTLTYRSGGLVPGIALAAFATVLLVATWWWFARRRNHLAAAAPAQE